MHLVLSESQLEINDVVKVLVLPSELDGDARDGLGLGKHWVSIIGIG